MKKLQLAHAAAEQVPKAAQIPNIHLVKASTPVSQRKRLDVHGDLETEGKIASPNHMRLPASHVDLKCHFYPLKTSHSTPHAPSIAETGKNVYHSEPANLNGYVSASGRQANAVSSPGAISLFFFFPAVAKTETERSFRPAFAPSCEAWIKFTLRKSTLFLVGDELISLSY